MENKAILCPNCRKLISNYVDVCPYCNTPNPGKQKMFFKMVGNPSIDFVKLIIGANIGYFVLSFLMNFVASRGGMGDGFMGIPRPSNFSLAILGWADPRLVLSGSWWLLVTAMFLHGGFLHIFFNMMWVRDLAPLTQELFSPQKMVIIYILSGIGGNLVSVLFSSYPVVGASGAVFGLMGAIIAYGRKRGGFLGQNLVRQLGLWAVILIGLGFVMPQISNAAHIGGFVTGFLIGSIIPLYPQMGDERKYNLLSMGLLAMTAFSFILMLLRMIKFFNQ